jgi:hypothetical protein
LKETFDIELAEKKSINKIGLKIISLGFFLFLVFWLCALPAKYLPAEIAAIYLIEVLNRNIYYVLAASMIVLLFGDWLNGMRNYEIAELEIQPDRIILHSKTKKIELEYDYIKKFHGVMNFTHSFKRPNFKIITINNEKYEIRAHQDVFNGLTDSFPDKN